jgi:hypothetical protein
MSDERLADELQRFAAMPYWNEYEGQYVAEKLLPKAAAQLAEAERREKRLEEALRNMTQLAGVSHEGDPWFAEDAGLDAADIFREARAALQNYLQESGDE